MKKIKPPTAEEVLSEEFLEKYKNLRPPFGFNGLGEVVYKRTYARVLENGATEDWWQTIARCIRGAQKIGASYTKEEAERLFDHIFNLRCSFAGRSLWQLGTPLVDRIADSLLNCWVCTANSIDNIVFIFTESMLGGGVGVNLSREYTQELPRVKVGVRCRLKNTKDADFIVPDSKEGWADLWRKLLEAYLVTGKSFTYSMVCIRTSGEPLKTFGGIAPGPQPLIDGAAELCRLMESREDKKLRTQDVADIICIGGEVVRSGGVRRTALLLVGDSDDIGFLNLKRWDLGGIPKYRSNSNNSILAPKFDYIMDRFWDGYLGNGEPYGLINLRNSRRFGRAGEDKIDRFNLKDDKVVSLNPCAEATLGNGEPCNLGELFLNNISSKEEMLDCAKLLYKTMKAIAAREYLHDVTNEIVHKNMKIGIGITGVCQKESVVEEWADFVYRNIRVYDREWSKKMGWPRSLRLTVVKPSGTLSLLAGSSPGGHPGFSRFHIRRVRFSSDDPLVIKLREAGYRISPEARLDGTYDQRMAVVEFPAMFGPETVLEKDCGVINQLEIVKKLQTCWADQAVSVTCYYRKEDVPAIKKWLKENYDENIKSLSFLLKEEHGFNQPPLEEITEEEYKKYTSQLKPLNLSGTQKGELKDSFECNSNSCPIV